MKTTSFLNLILPNSDTFNWGEVMNNNFSKIDNKMSEYNLQFQTFEKTLSGIRSLNIYEDQKYGYFIVENEQLKLKTGSQIDDTGNLEVVYTYTEDDWGEIGELSCFIMVKNYEASSNYPVIPIDITNIKVGDIIIKRSDVNSENTTIHYFTLIPQGLGGWYKPTTDPKTDYISWVRECDPFAPESLQTPFPQRDMYCSLNVKQLVTGQQTINTDIEANTMQIVSIFFVLYNATTGQYINTLVDHNIQYNAGKIDIQANVNSIPENMELYIYWAYKTFEEA